MKNKTAERPLPAADFDLFRISRSKEIVDVSPNTLRSYNSMGLPFYERGRVVFVSKRELEAFIRTMISRPMTGPVPRQVRALTTDKVMS